jgi:hypothetical protein
VLFGIPWTGKFCVVTRSGELPARFAEQNVDERVACFRFIVIVRVRRTDIGSLRGSDFLAQRRDFGFQLGAFGLAGEAFLFFLFARADGLDETRGCFLKLGQCRGGHCGIAWQHVGGEGQRWVGLNPARIGVSEPIADVKQLAETRDGTAEGDRTGFVRGLIAEVLDDSRFGNQRWTEQFLERRLVETCRERGLEGVLQRAFMAIEPIDDGLE